MKETEKRNVILGLFISIGFVLLVGLIYFLGNQRSLFGSNVEIEVYFKTVNGLRPGANVRFSGLNIGTVKEVSIANDSLVKAVLLIDDEAAGFVKKDAWATIESDGLMGNKIVSISGGTSGEYIGDNDVIKSKEPLAIDDMVASFKRASDNADTLTKNLATISAMIRSGEGLIGRLISDTLMASNVEDFMQAMENSGRHLDRVTGEMQQAAREINHGKGLMSKILYDEELSTSFHSMLDTMTVASRDLALASAHLKAFSEELSNDTGALHKLIEDQEVAADVAATLHNLNKGTANVDDVLETINNSWILNLFSGKEKKDKKKEN